MRGVRFVPVVRAVGGLEDTVEDYDGWNRGTGFKFRDYTPPALLLAARRAVETWRDAKAWRERRRPELLELFRTHVYGRSPASPRGVVFERGPAAG